MPRSSRSRTSSADYWPGFVDALTTLLLVVIFLLSVFVLAQYFLGTQLSEKDARVLALEAQVAELAEALSLARKSSTETESSLAQLQASLIAAQERAQSIEEERLRLSALLAALEKEKDATGTELVTLRERLSDEETQGDEAEAQIILLNEQIAALRLQLASLEEALDAADARDREQKAVIQDLGSRLNVALAQKVQELATYRSSFFEALQNALGERAEIEVVGDRFVLQSEILFASGSATINPDGRQELAKIAEVINEISSVIPDDVAWIIRVDGHSDVVPISTPEFPSNWHLSAARAIAVVRFLTARGVDPMHLAAAGFGEFDPLAEGRDPATLRRNRRIEFKLTDR